ncbi:MAG: S26 family signal peptidase [Desulfomonilia bacterium]|jgi:conjugative transfer signal peptidase TraF
MWRKKAELKPLLYALLIFAGFIIVCKVLSYKIMFQITPSLPKGIYWIDHPNSIEKGMICVFDIPHNVYGLMKTRGWLPEHFRFYLSKPLVAKQGDIIEVSANGLYINGKYFGPVKQYDSQGLPLPRIYRKYILMQWEYFFASSYTNSFDSRYFGTVRKENIRWVEKPLLVFSSN